MCCKSECHNCSYVDKPFKLVKQELDMLNRLDMKYVDTAGRLLKHQTLFSSLHMRFLRTFCLSIVTSSSVSLIQEVEKGRV